MRPTLGKILIESAVELVGKVCKANAARNKYQHLTDALEVVESIAAMWQAAHEVRLINIAAFAKAIELTEGIARQAAGITSSLGLMRQSKSHHARLRVCRDALRLGYVVDPRGTKALGHANR